MKSPEDLVRLIRSARPGPDAREQLWALCAGVVAALARRYTRAAPDLYEDYVSEAYLKFEQALATFDPNRRVPFRGYLSACVERHFQDRARKKSDRPITRLPDRAAGGDVLEALGDREQARLVHKALAALLPRDPRRLLKLRAFHLRHFEGWPMERIREELGAATTNAVAQWVFRVRQALGRELAAGADGEPPAPPDGSGAGAGRRRPRRRVTAGRRC